MTPAIFSPAGLALTADERAFFKDADPAGYILFGRNIQDRVQLQSLTQGLRDLHGRDDLFVSIDQEGGRVSRMKPPVWPAYPAQGTFAALWEIAPASAIEAARANAQLLAMDLREVGITVDYLPLLDVRMPGAHDVIGDRALGTEPKCVAALGRAVIDGLARGGVTGCIKHIPGHGRAGADSHKELPVVSASAAELETDLAPFRKLASHPLGMSAHVLYRAWDAERPATLSPTIIDKIIRQDIGFAGLLLTDDIDMQALDGSIPARAAAALAAGCEIALNCWGRMDDMVGIAEAIPAMTPQVSAKLDAVLAFPATRTMPADRAELVGTRDALLAQVGAAA